MEFPNTRVKKLLSHSSGVIHIGFFKSNNDEDHFYTLSNNGQLKEWLLNSNGSIIIMESNFLMRPGSEYLSYLGFAPYGSNNNNTKNSDSQKIFISAINVSESFISVGYEDGLVLVWRRERRDVINKNKLEHRKRLGSGDYPLYSDEYCDMIDEMNVERAKEENYVRKGKFRIDDITLFSLEDDLVYNKSDMIAKFEQQKEEPVEGENDIKFNYKEYYNIFFLKYLFIQQTQEISYLFYYTLKDKRILLSASKDGSIIGYNMDNGKETFVLRMENYVRYICFCEQIVKSKRIVPKRTLTLLCNESYKVNLNLEKNKEKPIFDSSDFKYNNFTKIVFLTQTNKFYLLGYHGECIIFNKNFEEEDYVCYPKTIALFDIIQYKKKFLLFTSEFHMSLVEFDLDKKKMKELFYIKFGLNRVTDLMYFNDILYVTNYDRNVYSIDFDIEYKLYEERVQMKGEEIFSEAFNKYYEAHKGKKKKKKKKGKGKGKGKKGSSPKKSPKKKSVSPKKKKK